VRIEAEAVIALLAAVERGEIERIGSAYLDFEIEPGSRWSDIRRPYSRPRRSLPAKRRTDLDRWGESMAVAELLKRITADPEIFGGKPIIRGMRISVELILSLLTQGETVEDILADYPDLEPDDIRACLAYAHAVIAHDSLDAVRIAGS
jgi:uncharacterized protein (DUF433 family)